MEYSINDVKTIDYLFEKKKQFKLHLILWMKIGFKWIQDLLILQNEQQNGFVL